MQGSRRLIYADDFANEIASIDDLRKLSTKTIGEALSRCRTIEAVPVVHGRWIDHGDYVTTAYGSLDIKVCSCCEHEITIDDFDSYCPNCGAKMDGIQDKAI